MVVSSLGALLLYNSYNVYPQMMRRGWFERGEAADGMDSS